MSFQKYRVEFTPKLPRVFYSEGLAAVHSEEAVKESVKQLFPCSIKQGVRSLKFRAAPKAAEESAALRLGCVLSGGQAPGGHNVIVGLYDYIKRVNPESRLYGFLNGPIGIYTNSYKELTEDIILKYKNTGGFDMICSGRHKIEKPEQFANSLKYCEALGLDGLVVIGGDDSNTNAGLLAEYFLSKGSKVRVIGVPKTIDGDLKNEFVEVSFGFDTACKTYSQCIGNIMIDCLSTKKYYHFIRLMGRSASHIALECALLTHPNAVLIGEEVQRHKTTLAQIVQDLKDMIRERAKQGKNYGVVLVPEGLVEFIGEIKGLISEINKLLGKNPTMAYPEVAAALSPESSALLNSLPREISNQLLLDRDPHGNVQVAKIQTQRLIISMLQQAFKGEPEEKTFKCQSHYFGYEGRCAFPTQFDCEYCYGLGFTAAALIGLGGTGLMSCIKNLAAETQDWEAGGFPLVTMMDLEVRKGHKTPVITKALVKQEGELFKLLAEERKVWRLHDYYCNPGPIQFELACLKPFLAVPPSRDQLYSKSSLRVDNTFAPIDSKFNFSPLMETRSKQMLSTKDLTQHEVVFGDVLPFKSTHIRVACEEKFPSLVGTSMRIIDLQYQGPGTSKPVIEKARVGICFNTRQLPGCHNIIQGLLKAGVQLYGFVGGTHGLFKCKYIRIGEAEVEAFRNIGGLHMLGRDKDRVRSADELAMTLATVKELDLDGLVLVGATHTLTDALILSEYFLGRGAKTRVVGVPCSIDQSVCHPLLELNLGFSTNSHFMASMVANLLTDASSNTKYWYFIRLMSKEMSFLMLEVALKTKPNIVLIGEEIFKSKAMGIREVVAMIADVVEGRSARGMNFGCVILGDGLLSWIMEFIRIFREIDDIRHDSPAMSEQAIVAKMSPWTRQHFTSLPEFARSQFLLERQTNGSPKYNEIQTERLLACLVSEQLAQRKKAGTFKGAFAPVCHYFGYQGRSSLPNNFDAQLGTSYGQLAARLVQGGATGYCTSIRGLLSNQPSRWHMCGVPLLNLLDIKEHSSYGIGKLVIRPSQLKLNSRIFSQYLAKRQSWKYNDHYENPGPIQFAGRMSACQPQILRLEYSSEYETFRLIEGDMKQIRSICKSVGDEQLLQITHIGLGSLLATIRIMRNRLND